MGKIIYIDDYLGITDCEHLHATDDPDDVFLDLLDESEIEALRKNKQEQSIILSEMAKQKMKNNNPPKQFTREELIKMYFDNMDGPLQNLPDDIIEKLESLEVGDSLFLNKPAIRRELTKEEAYALDKNLVFVAKQLLALMKTSKIKNGFAFFTASAETLETMIMDYEYFRKCYKNELPISDLDDEAAVKLSNAKFKITRQLIESL